MPGRTLRSHALVSLLKFDMSTVHLTYNRRLPKNAPKLVPLALYAGLTTEEQLRVFEPTGRGSRKVIISTNIAEVCARPSPSGPTNLKVLFRLV